MAKDSNRAPGTSKAEKTGRLVPGLLAEENEFDRSTLWRIGTWGAVAVGAVALAVAANQFSLGRRREQVAAADLAHQARRLQSLALENQTKTRELATEIETLDSDRDRLFARVTVLEQGLDSVTGAISRQHSAATKPTAPPAVRQMAKMSPQSAGARRPPQTRAAASPPAPAPVKTMAAVSTKQPPASVSKPPPLAATAKPRVTMTGSVTPQPHAPAIAPQRPTPAVASKNIAAQSTAAREPAASKPSPVKPAVHVAAAAPKPRPAPRAVASISPAEKPADERTEQTPRKQPETAASAVAVKHTDFAVDLGSARSVDGLRALWRGLSHDDAELARLRPIIVIRESHGGREMRLHLAAGPLKDAATAAKICAGLTGHGKRCGTTVFDGQRLSMKGEEGGQIFAEKPKVSRRPVVHRRNVTMRVKKEDPPAPPPPPPPPEHASLFSALFGKH
ncbi:MAG: hypothetical protein ACREDL_11630 [Bradyrhizobium sp.]